MARTRRFLFTAYCLFTTLAPQQAFANRVVATTVPHVGGWWTKVGGYYNDLQTECEIYNPSTVPQTVQLTVTWAGGAMPKLVGPSIPGIPPTVLGSITIPQNQSFAWTWVSNGSGAEGVMQTKAINEATPYYGPAAASTFAITTAAGITGAPNGLVFTISPDSGFLTGNCYIYSFNQDSSGTVYDSTSFTIPINGGRPF